MRLHIPVPVRWSDLDAYGHVNNAQMLTLLEEARVHGFWSGDESVPGSARVFTGGADSDTFTLIARQEIEYLEPIPHLRDPLDIEMWIGNIGGASLEVCYEVYAPVGTEPRTLFTRATTIIVLVDSQSMRPRRVSDAEREILNNFVEPAIVYRRGSKD